MFLFDASLSHVTLAVIVELEAATTTVGFWLRANERPGTAPTATTIPTTRRRRRITPATPSE
jgi:hypothetical protein